MGLRWLLTDVTVGPSHSPVQRGGPVPPGFFGTGGDAFEAGKCSILDGTLMFLAGVTAGITGRSFVQFGMKAKRLWICFAALSGHGCAHWKGGFLGPVQLFFLDSGKASRRVPSFVILLHGSRCLKGLLAFLTVLHRRQDWFGALALVRRVICMCCGEELVVICWWAGLFGFALAAELGFKGPGLELLKEFTGFVKKCLVYVPSRLWLRGHCMF